MVTIKQKLEWVWLFGKLGLKMDNFELSGTYAIDRKNKIGISYSLADTASVSCEKESDCYTLYYGSNKNHTTKCYLTYSEFEKTIGEKYRFYPLFVS